MQKFLVKVVGSTPYMQHRMDDTKLTEWLKLRGNILEPEISEPEQKAIFHSYVDKDGKFYIPNEHFKQCFLNGGKNVKGKVGATTKSLKQVVAGMWFIRPFNIPFRKFDEIDSRSAVNQNVKARVMVHRPKWNEWQCEFELHIDEPNMTIETIKEIIRIGGNHVGVGSYRPEHAGEFGRFDATVEKIS